MSELSPAPRLTTAQRRQDVWLAAGLLVAAVLSAWLGSTASVYGTEGPCSLTTLKTNFGHAQSAAGALTRFRADEKTQLPSSADIDVPAPLAHPGWALVGGDVFEDERRVVVRLELPGMERQDIDLQVTPELLVEPTLSASTIAVTLALGVGVVALAPLLGARRERHLDIPAALRVVE